MRLIGVGLRRPTSKKGMIATIVVLIVIVAVLFFTGKVNVTADENGIVAKATWEPTTTIKYGDVKDVEVRNDLDLGKKKSGLSTFKVDAGRFKNKEFGSYKLYADIDCKQYIVITLKSEDIIVVNGRDKAATEALYQQIKEHV